MNADEIRYQQIEDYLKGRLSESERISFESEISLNSQLAQEVAVQKVALQSLEMAYMKSMSDLVRDRIQKNNTAKKYWLGGGAILFTSLLIGGMYLMNTMHSDTPAGEKETAVYNKSAAIQSASEHNENLQSSKENKRYLPEEKITALSNTAAIEKPMAPTSDSSLMNKGKMNESIQQVSFKKTVSPSETSPIESDKQNFTSASSASKTSACPQAAPEISVRTTPTSLDENTGTLIITKPVNWKVYIKGVNTDYENTNQFTDLAAGNYIVYVKNELDCTYQIGNYAVTNTNCMFEKNYVFNKQFDKEWKVPAQTSAAYKIIILNKAGIEVYSENVAAHTDVSWNGLNKNGDNVALGLHKVIVTYSDNKTCIYNVVVSE